jgi:hypothetical protein
VGGLVVNPNLDNFSWTITASTAVNAVTWTAADHPKATSIASDSSFYRTVSMGIRIMDVGAMIERGMSMYVGRRPPSLTQTAPAVDTIDLVTSSPNFELLDLAKLQASGTDVIWLPMTAYGASVGGSTLGPCATQWRDPIDNVIDLSVLVMVVSTRADTPSDELAIETVMNIEFVPKFQSQFLFSVKTAPGGPDGLAESQAHLAKVAPALHKAAGTTGHTGYLDSAKAAWNFTAPARQFLSDNWSTISSLGIELLGGGGSGKSLDAKEPPPLKRERGAYHIVCEDDAKTPSLGSPTPSVRSLRTTRF